jgi:hypothetical protein
VAESANSNLQGNKPPKHQFWQNRLLKIAWVSPWGAFFFAAGPPNEGCALRNINLVETLRQRRPPI